jgi:hypothetical protein
MSRHPWMPLSPCGTPCLTGGEPSVGRVRAAGRLVAAIGVVFASLLFTPLLVARPGLVRLVFRGVLRAFGCGCGYAAS